MTFLRFSKVRLACHAAKLFIGCLTEFQKTSIQGFVLQVCSLSGISYDCYKGYDEFAFPGLEGRCDRLIGTLEQVPGLINALSKFRAKFT